MMRKKQRMLALFLAVCLTVGMLPQTAFATEAGQDSSNGGITGLCEHHTAHNETCGYGEEEAASCLYAVNGCKECEATDCTCADGEAGHEEGCPLYSASVVEAVETGETEEMVDTTYSLMTTAEGETAATSTEVSINADNFPDEAFRKAVEQYDLDGSGGFSQEELEKVNSLSVEELGITSLKGIEHFTALTWLSCPSNSLSELDMSQNPELTTLDCNENGILSKLDVSQNPKLTTLLCSNTNLSKLDVSQNPELTELRCYNTSLSELDVSQNPKLTILDCHDTSLSKLNVSQNPELTHLFCFGTSLSELDVSQNPKLTYLNCSGTSLSKLDVSYNPELTELYCFYTSLSELDVSQNTKLTHLDCEDTSLSKLDVSKNPELTHLDCSGNKLTSLDLSANPGLGQINFYQTVDLNPEEGTGTWNLDLSALVSSNLLSGITVSVGGYDSTTGIWTLPEDEPTEVSYTLVSGSCTMEVTVYLDYSSHSHDWSWESLGDNAYKGTCKIFSSHTQTLTFSSIEDIQLNLVPKVGEVLNPEAPSVDMEVKRWTAGGGEKTFPEKEFITSQGWELKPLNGDWEEVEMPLTLEEKHMGGSLRYTLRGDWGEEHSQEVILSPGGLWITGIEPLSYTGSKVTQSFQLYDGDTLLQEKVDYTISYQKNIQAYELEGSTAQSGTASVQEGSSAQSEAASSAAEFSPAIAIVSEGGEALSLMSEGNGVSVTDVSYYNTKTAPRVVVKMKGNYKGTYTIYFPIEKQDMSEVLADDLTVTWTGNDQKPKPVVTWEGKKLTYNKDYSIEEYQDNTGYSEAGTHTLTLKGKGNFKGTKALTLTITRDGKQIAMDKVTVSGVKAQTFSSEGAKQSSFTVKYKNTPLTEKTADQAGEYTVSYLNNNQAGTATLVLTGTGEDANGDGTTFKGVKKVTFKVTGTVMNTVQVTGLDKAYDYTGEEIRPTDWYTEVAADAQAAAGQEGQNPTDQQTGEDEKSKAVQLTGKDPATGDERPLVEGKDYEVSYQKNINKGTATILFTGKPEAGFTGVLKKTFKIQARTIEEEAS